MERTGAGDDVGLSDAFSEVFRTPERMRVLLIRPTRHSRLIHHNQIVYI